jgi:hypothetical protein
MLTKARISIVLATDSFSTIEPVIRCLRKQTRSHELEVVLATPDPEAMRTAVRNENRFAAVAVVEDAVTDLAVARAAGVRGSSAPIIFIGETHSFPAPDMTELILESFEGAAWACVVPSVYNANPRGTISWSGCILDYGRWAAGASTGQIESAPVYNAAFRREVLLALGDRLPFALGQTDELGLALTANRQRVLFVPHARIGHANVTGVRDWFWNRLLGGNLIATNRSRQWSAKKRIVYFGGSFLIPAVLLRRLLPGVRRTRQSQALPPGTLLAVVLGLVLRAGGEALGYAGLLGQYSARRMHSYELHKLKYARCVSV